MIFRLNLYITIRLTTFIRGNWATQVSVETIYFYKYVTCDDIGTLANILTTKDKKFVIYHPQDQMIGD